MNSCFNRVLRVAVPISAIALSLFTSAHANNLQMQRVALMDHNGSAQPMPAIDFMVPQGWRTQGGVVWNDQNHCNQFGYNFNWQATSPDGAYGVKVLPQVYWSTARAPIAQMQGNCINGTFGSVQELITTMMPHIAQGGRLLDYRPRPDVLEQYKLQNSRQGNEMMQIERTVDAGEALIAYQENGREMRQILVVALVNTTTRFEPLPGMQNRAQVSGMTTPAFVSFAPAGQLDISFSETVRSSYRINPQWEQLIQQHQAAIMRSNVKGARDRSRIIADSNEHISGIISGAYAARSAVNDRLSRETSENIRGVETYHDPYNGGTVELDNSYDHAWQTNDGSYVLSNDDLYQPGLNSQRLTPVE